jgi:DNA mismatch repair protein MutH
MEDLTNSTFDSKDPKSIEKYAQRLIGHTFQEVEDFYYANRPRQQKPKRIYSDSSCKGGLGNLIEELFFEYKANSISAPDFPEAGVELKQTPFERKKDGSLRAGERVVLSMIGYQTPIEASFLDSHFWRKNQLILFIYYWRNRLLANNMHYKIEYVKLFTPPEADLQIIMNDYKVITEKIAAGKAHELSESDTLYLGACTKGATAETSFVDQYYPPNTPAKKRAFCYKQSYMNVVLNDYIAQNKTTYEPIIKDALVLAHETFEQYISSLIEKHIGKTDKELCLILKRPYNNNKAQWTDLAYRMLGIKSNRAEEFIKANIVVKVIRLELDGRMRESMSFPPFKFRELIDEKWDNSTIYNYFDETRFLFVVFKSNGNQYVLRGCQMWNMPYSDLGIAVKNGWEAVRQTIVHGVKLTVQNTKNGFVVKNNFPKKSDNAIIHIRPHAPKRYYEFLDGTILGNGTRANANELLDGTWMPNQSFWVNNSYILSKLDKRLK